MERIRDESTPHTTRTGVRIGGNFDRDKMPRLDDGDRWVQSALLSPPIATIRRKRRFTMPSGAWWSLYIIAAFAIIIGVVLTR